VSVAVALAAGAAQAQLPTLSGFVIARSLAGETELPVTLAPAQTLGPLVTESPPSGDPELPGTHTTQAATLAADLAAGFVAMATGSEGEVLGQGVRGLGRGSARWQYLESVLVQSASVPAGTPVTVRLRYRLVFGRECLHDLGPEVLASSSNTQVCITDLEVRGSLNNFQGGVQSATHNHYVPVGFDSTVTGLFADPSQLGEASVVVEVGEPLRVDLFVDAAGHLEVARYGEGLPTAATGTALVVVFGVESDAAGVEIVSPLLGGPLPGFANVTTAAALAQLLMLDVGAPVTVPEPDAPAAIALVALAIAARRARAPSA
jgi:hypothetical protein